ncbi:cob(I)yrinic acid a,c-diamide adenosyltransferase [Enterovirga sp.]|uniref:cob(I)yrinic acid a,c-diamide adenosyltransferase n=1 Tax=Enterovirga sp. TaxID=2026350 RepID=UPI002C883A3D|nr:cob(I)yrinic acid a,c-diamide adenosyltransferase [Enterovirga sp.]HMO28890.1 cob(I)yrinic acid a,c-diamide adenosyltransferase [Enterovirga sp.]
MVALNRIYTKAGDGGRTQLVGGERRKKHDLRIECYGTVDELNASIGLARLHTAGEAALDAMLARIQNDLFDLGADLATPPRDAPAKREDLRILDSQVERLEREIDGMNEGLAPLRSFVLPGGTAAAAHLHLARTVCRRAERRALLVDDANRLSDLLFVAARHANGQGRLDVLWVPGQNR